MENVLALLGALVDEEKEAINGFTIYNVQGTI